MDQTNLLPNNPRRLPSNGVSLIQGSPGPWMVHPHTSPMSPWHAQSLPLGPLYFHQHSFQQASTHPGPAQATQAGQHSALPHPDRSLRALQNPDSVVGRPAASIFWASNLQPMSGVMDSVPGTNSVMNATSGSISENELGNINYFSTRGLALQPPVAADWASPGVTSDSLSTNPSLFPSSERLANVPEPADASSSSTTLPYPLSPISAHNSTQVPLTSSQRTQRPQSSVALFEHRDSTSLATPASDPRRQAYSRSRRSMSSRQSGPDLSRTQDEAGQDPSGEMPTPLLPRPHRRVSLTDDVVARQMQMFRGTMSSKLVASRAAVQSLESVEISSLPENEKACVICYNDYGVESPEGVNEAPLRLPPCKHVFGDHCIKKWLEDSDSCPYCRSKLQAEPKHSYGSATTFINMMRMRGLPLPAGLSDEVIARLAARPITETEFQELFNRAVRNRERRPPPDDAATQDQRRTRQRRSGPVPGEARFAGVGAMHSRSASDAPPSQEDLGPREGGSWGAQTAVAGSAPPPQHRLQPRLVMSETSAQLNGMNESRGQAASSRTPRPTDPMAPVVVNGSSLRERSIPNPLQSQAQFRSVISTPTLSGTIHASSLSTMEDQTRQPVDTELSALRPSRNRPW